MEKSFLKKIFGKDFSLSESDLKKYSKDESLISIKPLAIVFPKEREQIINLVKWAKKEKVAIVPRGSGTGLAGGSIGKGIILDMKKMKKIKIFKNDLMAECQPGVINSELQKKLKKYGFFWPPDPSSWKECTVGGNLSTNAGGISCLKYGVTNNWVLSLDVIDGNGDFFRTGSKAIKDVSGYDLTNLFIGSEGTLGIIVNSYLKILEIPKSNATLIATYKNFDTAAEKVQKIRNEKILPEALEILDKKTLKVVNDYHGLNFGKNCSLLLCECSGDKRKVEEEVRKIKSIISEKSIDLKFSFSKEEREKLWIARRGVLESLKSLGKVHVEDITVPISSLSKMVKKIDKISKKNKIEILTMGHAGDGNLHPQFIMEENSKYLKRLKIARFEILNEAVKMNGTITGEHGIGLTKKESFYKNTNSIKIKKMKKIKNVFDPIGIMNPGKIFK
tara:strand:+ start:368 stop:1708 length:1341 start_codon:yes stop_codon:yes gene_type:complete